MSHTMGKKSSIKGGPTHFLVRTTCEVVPLIAVDELPSTIDIVGVPRSLDLISTVGMLNLGSIRATGQVYDVVQKKEEDFKAAVKEGTSEAYHQADKDIEILAPVEVEGALATNSMAPIIANLAPKETQPPSPVIQSMPCRHWCRYGVCRWGQQCRYRHLMPMILSGLRDVGLMDWPAWYQNPNLRCTQEFINTLPMCHAAPAYQHEQVCRRDCCTGIRHRHDLGHGNMMAMPIPGMLNYSMYAGHILSSKQNTTPQQCHLGIVEKKRRNDASEKALAGLCSRTPSAPDEAAECEDLEELIKGMKTNAISAPLAKTLRNEILVERDQDGARRAWADLSSSDEDEGGKEKEEEEREEEKAARSAFKANKFCDSAKEPQLIVL